MGPDAWRVTGAGGQQLGEHLWKIYLEAGGPWPGEFRLRAAASGVSRVEGAGVLLSYRRRGPSTEA